MKKCILFFYFFLSTQMLSAQSKDTVFVGKNEWVRCSLGQIWDGSSCHGAARAYSFAQAILAVALFNRKGYAGKTDWRLPTVRELQSLRACITGFESEMRDLKDGGTFVPRWCKQSNELASINPNLFPATVRGWYWTGSTYDTRVSPIFGIEMWGVDFEYGLVSAGSIDKSIFVRLVR
jgi:hypothetical protein